MNVLTSKQKAYLKSKAHTLASIHQLGKNQITPEFIEMLNKALKAHELVKIHTLKSAEVPLRELALDVAGATKSQIVQIIGRYIILYKENPSDRKIKFPG